ncbi:hypothetical protein AAHH67_08480 [Niallia circulans]
MEVIHIYHTNDLHSHFENWPRIYELLRERKNGIKRLAKLFIYLI